MYIIFMNFEVIKTSSRHRILLNLSNKLNLKWSDKYVALSNFKIYYTFGRVNAGSSKCTIFQIFKEVTS